MTRSRFGLATSPGRAGARLGRIAVAALALCALAGAAWAQTAPSRRADPARIQKQLERPEAAPEVTPGQVIPGAGKVKPLAPDERRVVLSAVHVTGATVFSPQEIAHYYEPLLGREIGLEDIETLLDTLTARYRDRGLFLSRAIAGPQTLALGVLEIRMIEGYVSRVTFSGTPTDRQGLLTAMADKITRERPLSLSTLERYVLLIRDLAGMRVEPSLDETEDGSGVYVLNLALSRQPLDVYASFDNRGTDEVGPLQAGAQLGINSPLGLLGRTQISAYTVPDQPEELIYAQIYDQVPVGTEGMHVWASASRSQVEALNATGGGRYKSWYKRFVVGAWQPLVRERAQSLRATLRLEHVEADRRGAGDRYQDNLNVAAGGLRYTFADPLGGPTTVAAEYVRGLKGLGASEHGDANLSRVGGEPGFSKWTLDVTRQQKIDDQLWLQVDASGQYSDATLLSSEEFAVGGNRFGRAFDAGEQSGSSGLATAAEARFSPPLGSDLATVWIYGFADWAVVDPQYGALDYLASAGVGLRLFAFHGLTADLQAARPILRARYPSQGPGTRVFFSLNASF